MDWFHCFCTPGGSKRSNQNEDLVQFIDGGFDSLSQAEKIRVHNEIYGVEEPVEETAAFINAKLLALEREINLLGEDIKRPYLQAVMMEEEEEKRSIEVDTDITHRGGNNTFTSGSCLYVRSVEFRVMFLRAEKFDEKLAARRITRYFQEKLNLFGQEKLPRRITQADLNERDMDALYTGGYCTVGSTDKNGRLIFIGRRKRFANHKVVNLKRGCFYIIQATLESSEISQKKGVVVVVQNRNFNNNEEEFKSNPFETRRIFPLMRMLSRGVPKRTGALHLLYDDMFSHIAIKLVLAILPKNLLPVSIPHYYVDDDECKEELRDYGIDFDALPLTKEGDIDTERVRNYYMELRKQEESMHR